MILNYANAAKIEISPEYRWINPKELNRFSELGSSSSWLDYKSKELFSRANTLKASLLFNGTDNGAFGFGFYLRYLFPLESEHQATNLFSGVRTSKKTVYSGFSAGAEARLDFSKEGVPLFLNFGIGMGARKISQSISGSDESTLIASATNSEIFMTGGYAQNFSKEFSSAIYLGLMRETTNIFSVNSVKGSAYSGLSPENKLFVELNGKSQDLKGDLSGFLIGISFSLSI